MRKIVGTLILVGVVLGVCACTTTNDISIESVWARPGFQGDYSAVYLTIRNPSDQADILLQSVSDVAGSTEIHLSKMDSEGVMTMERQYQVPIPANDMVEFAPGGLHIMLVNLNQDLSVGDTFPLTLIFHNQGEISVEVEVKQP